MTLEIERLTDDDVDAAWELSTQVGWNQTVADWTRLLTLFPETCYAGFVDGELVATSSLATYGTTVGWIGMVLVDEHHRRQGYGGAVFERALEAGIERDLEIVGLDATDAGRAVYRQYGFETVCRIDRWGGELDTSRSGEGDEPGRFGDDSSVRDLESVDEIDAFDREYAGADRRALLAHVLESTDATGYVYERGTDVRGYALVRPGRTAHHVGPLVALEREDADALLAAVAEGVGGPVVVDALRTDRNTAALESVGLEIQRELYRMTHEEPRRVLDGDAVLAAAGFEWG